MRRRILRWLMKCFDKAFYRSKGEQFLWLVALVAIFLILGMIVGHFFNITEWEVVELMLNPPGTFSGSYNEGPLVALIELTIAVIGAVVFTSLLINAFGNWLDRRIDAYKKGEVVYSFDNHVLIFGANSMLINILKSVLNDSDNDKCDIVIQTTTDVEELRKSISAELSSKDLERIYVIYGKRNVYDSLRKLDVDESKSIYIIGEENESMHDSINIECYQHLKEICTNSLNVINCYIAFDRLSTLQSYHYTKQTISTDKLHVTIINSLESAAQRVLVNGTFQDGIKYPSLDRNGIGPDSNIQVHFIICGMSQMGYAMAITAAHNCHFPNFVTKGIRTKITFIQEQITQEMDYFRSRYQNLMKLSVVNYIDIKNSENNRVSMPEMKYIDPLGNKEGFLDIEWEFINGGIETPEIREYIETCVSQEQQTQYVTIAFCNNNPEQNVAASLYLPRMVFDNNIPIFVYQSGKSEVLNVARQTEIYSNIYPFGMKPDCYDEQYFERIFKARRITHLYSLADSGKPFEAMPADSELIEHWFSLQYAFQQSNLYAANSIQYKLRSINYDGHSALTENEIKVLSEVEHNRWNVERLLTGFVPYRYTDRIKFRDILLNGTAESKSKCKQELNKAKKEQFLHKDIAPYSELLESSKEYDIVITRNITAVNN